MVISSESKHFQIKGYKGTFSVVQETEIKGVPCYLVEHDEGPEVCDDLIVDAQGRVVTDEVWF
ncbi:MAG: hypothetical protein ACOX7B_11810 [Christensenellales bacterium]|jgi:hypothetical protein